MADDDEDNIGVSDTGTISQGEPIKLAATDTPEPKRRGRARRVTIDMIDQHLLRVAAGKRVPLKSGPTGKIIWGVASLSEQLKAAELVKKKLADAQDQKPPPAAEPSVDEDKLRKAVLEHVLASGKNSAEPEPDEKGIVSVTDTEQIKRWDAERAAYEQRSTEKKSVDPEKPNGPETSKTFENGFSWMRRRDKAIGKDVFDLYNPAGQLCGTRQAVERAEKWCEQAGSL